MFSFTGRRPFLLSKFAKLALSCTFVYSNYCDYSCMITFTFSGFQPGNGYRCKIPGKDWRNSEWINYYNNRHHFIWLRLWHRRLSIWWLSWSWLSVSQQGLHPHGYYYYLFSIYPSSLIIYVNLICDEPFITEWWNPRLLQLQKTCTF